MPQTLAHFVKHPQKPVNERPGKKERRKRIHGPGQRSLLKRAFSESQRFGISPTLNEDAEALHKMDTQARHAEERHQRDREANKFIDEIRKAGRAGMRTMQMLSVRRITSKIRAYNLGVTDRKPRFLELTSNIQTELQRQIRVRQGDSIEVTMGIVYDKTPFPVQEIFIRVADSSRKNHKLFELKPETQGVLYAKVASELMAKAEKGELQITPAEQENFTESARRFNQALSEFVTQHAHVSGDTVTIPRTALRQFPIHANYLTPALIAEELKRKKTELFGEKRLVI
ncbi:MAG: hypothetical protein Q7S92_04160 [Candidatus Diapherotrites archaeon]|nr:hypothetical protein [Candidatus Diapherotrites archaeon]